MLLVCVTISLMLEVVSGVGSIDWVNMPVGEIEGVQIPKRCISVMFGVSVMELVVVDEMIGVLGMAEVRDMPGPRAPCPSGILGRGMHVLLS